MLDLIEEQIKKTVITRLDVLPPDKKMSIGASGEFSRDEFKNLVKRRYSA